MNITPITTQLATIPSADFTKDKVIGGHWKSLSRPMEHPSHCRQRIIRPSHRRDLFENVSKRSQLMAQCHHPNIVPLYGLCLEEGKLALIMGPCVQKG